MPNPWRIFIMLYSHIHDLFCMTNTARKKYQFTQAKKMVPLLSLEKKYQKLSWLYKKCFSCMSLEQPEKAYQRPVRAILQLNLGSKYLNKLGVAGRPKLAQKFEWIECNEIILFWPFYCYLKLFLAIPSADFGLSCKWIQISMRKNIFCRNLSRQNIDVFSAICMLCKICK